MNKFGKWIDGISPESGVGKAARLSLEARLLAVAHWLPLAAGHAQEDVEHVHRLRVSSRRAVAALRLYRDWMPRRPARWLRKRLREVRQAAGDARDLDVLVERLRWELGDRGDGLLAEVMRWRAAAQPAIVSAHERACRRNRLRRKVDKLLRGIGPRGKLREAHRRQSFRHWATRELHTTAEQFFAAMPTDQFDTAALHRFRIRGKALRYGIELLAPAFSPELREKHYPVVEELQERLGRINDHATGAERLRQWSGSVGGSRHQMLLHDSIAREEAQLAQELEEFRQWWTPERAEALRQGLIGGCAEGQPTRCPAAVASSPVGRTPR